MRSWARGLGLAIALVAGCDRGPPPGAKLTRRVDWIGHGVWLKVDTRAHTSFSDGAASIEQVVQHAVTNGCDVVAITDRADAGGRAATPEYAKAIAAARKQFPKTIVLAGLDWNIPPFEGKEQGTVLVPPGPNEWATLVEFKTRFDDVGRPIRLHRLADEGLDFLGRETLGPRPLVMLSHPSREARPADQIVETAARWHGINDILIGFEGAPGHQGATPVGRYRAGLETINRWDPVVAQPGGAWDHLLAQGIDIWGALAPSDFVSDAGPQRDHWPGEFAETWLYARDRSVEAVFEALRAGTFFGCHGHIARNVTLEVNSEGLTRPAQAGEVVELPAPGSVQVALKFELPELDWRGEPNRIDNLEIIGITPANTEVILSRPPSSSGSALVAEISVPAGGLVLRARGRRVIDDGPDLLFYTNPVRILIRPPSSMARIAGHMASKSYEFFADRQVLRIIGIALVLVLGFGSVRFWVRWDNARRRAARNEPTVSRGPTPPSPEFVRGHQAPRPVPRAVHYWLALLVFIGLAVYGSLVPFDYTPLSMEDAVERFQKIPYLALGIASRADFVANILLFVPIGFFAFGCLWVDRGFRLWTVLASPLVLAACLALGIGIEFVQLWFPTRTVSQNDVLAQCLGTIVGAMLWFVAGSALTRWARVYTERREPDQQFIWLLQAYAVGLVIYSMLPLDLTLSPGELAHKYREGKVLLVPFAHSYATGWAMVYDLAGDLAQFAPVGMMLALVGRPSRSPRPVWQCALLGFPFCAAIEAAQLFVYSRFTDVTDIVVGTAGIALGSAFTGWYVGTEDAGSAWDRRRAPVGHVPGWVWFVAGCVYAPLVAAFYWAPFDFRVERSLAEPRWETFFRAPFAAMYAGTEFNAITQLLRKVLSFAPFGLFMALALGRTRGRIRWILLTFFWGMCLAWAIVIELGQLFLPSRTPDFTDALLCFVGSVLGYVVAVRVQNRGQPVIELIDDRGPRLSPEVEEEALEWDSLGRPREDGWGAGPLRPERFLKKVRHWRRRPLIQWIQAHPVPIAVMALIGIGWGLIFAIAPSRRPARPRGVAAYQPILTTYAEQAGSVFQPTPARLEVTPQTTRLDLPEILGGEAVWGAIGRDHTGHIWFAVSVRGIPLPSAHLFEYEPATNKLTARGDVVTELKRAGQFRVGAGQMTIQSRIVEGPDGHLYFASRDEEGENGQFRVLPTWGSHLWRYRLPEGKWEHLLAAPEGLIAVAGLGGEIYALGYYDHVLYQYDCERQQTQQQRIGSVGSHTTRQFLADYRGHAYVPRLVEDRQAEGGARVDLVEWNRNLEEVGHTKLDHYFEKDVRDGHGITAFCYLADRTILFTTEKGYLFRISPREREPASVEGIGWLHPNGPCYASSLFAVDGVRYVVGTAAAHKYANCDTWFVFDLYRKQGQALPLETGGPALEDLKLYGSNTRDDAGGFYVGGWRKDKGDVSRPSANQAPSTIPGMRGAPTGRQPALYRLQIPR